ncbi:PAS domain S-box protein [Polaromonas sp.]|uniref:PAS domain S-box protein n=1 Tax=Polaromonas sp. TaxID=1869339 RepID=UPI00272FCAD9|nr:PAS domain S-box protein [Polaromonas sp.]MDP1740021.1 PAS domain S-box protein [Polaromonas sp.]
MKLPFRPTIITALSVGVVLIAGSITASYLTINSLIRGTEQEAQTQETLLFLESVISDFKTTESLQRRYLLTRTDSDLALYRQASMKLQQALPQVLAVRGASGELEDWRTLESAMSGRIQLMERAVEVGRTAGVEAAAAFVGNELNRKLNDEIAALLPRIRSGEIRTLDSAREAARENAQNVKYLIVAGGVLSLGVLLWAAIMIFRTQAKRLRVQEKLADSEALASAVAESMADGVVTVTQAGLVVNANTAARQLFGYTLQELQGQHVALLLPERYRMAFRAFFESLALRRPGFRESDTQVMGQRRDGKEFPVRASFGDVNVGGQRLFTAIIRDVTESKQIADALRDSEAQMRQLTDNVPALIAYVDRDRYFRFHNKAYEEVFGLPRAKIQGKTMLEVMGPALYAEVSEKVDEVLAGYAVRYEREHTTPNGEKREYVMSYLPRYGEEEEEDKVVGFFSLGTDISELKRIDRMKSEFVSTVSHELRTPLTSIRGSLGLISGGIAGVLPDKAHSLVEIAKNNCERLIRLINDILDSEKIESGKMQFELRPMEMLPLMEQALADNQGFAAQHKVKLALQAPRLALRVNVDSDRLLQVMANLLSNAIKFSPPEGTVRVMLGRHAGRVRVEVSDDGPGIPEEFRGRIFQKFSQADSSDTRQKGGTGLGLNIVKAMMERMDGSIAFASKVNVGTTFYFELPEWREAPPVTAPMGLDGISRPRVLVCEDDPDVAQLIAMMLDKGGFDADVAHTAAQARECLKTDSYVAMTVDVKLPYESGLELIHALRQEARTADIPILVLSVTAAEARQHASATLAVFDWLDKPIDERRLLGSLRLAISGRAGASGSDVCER